MLYIAILQQERLDKQYPTSSKLAAPKRSYDQMTQTMKNQGRIETVGHSVGKLLEEWKCYKFNLNVYLKLALGIKLLAKLLHTL